MKKKTKKSTKIIIIILAVGLACFLLIPRVAHSESGSVMYEAPLYTVSKHRSSLGFGNEEDGIYEEGYTVEILGITVYDHQGLVEKG